jgi:hypothetical protein
MVKEFALALEREMNDDEEEELLPFKIQGDDTQLYAMTPTEADIALVAGAMSQYAEDGEKAVAILDLFWSLMDPPTARHLRRRLRDRSDRFQLADVMNVLEWIVEERTGRPTKPSSGSTASQPSTGARSTANSRRKASTRSRSPQIASAT